MNLDEFILKVEGWANEFKKLEPIGIAVGDVVADMQDRIFDKGLNSDGGKIGTYDNNNEIRVYPEDLARKIAPRGKNKRKEKKNGKPYKMVWFNDYQTLRSEQGRESAFINLRFTADLQNDFIKSKTYSNGKWLLGTQRKLNTEKMNGNEARFGKIFDLTLQERELFNKRVQELTLDIFK
jgi:hypothetical protein